jgi:transcriptional regulator with XRE-family HTH domain
VSIKTWEWKMTNAEMDLIDSNFNTRLIGLIKAYKVKKSDLAKALEVDRNTVHMWASGRSNLPNGYNLYQLARYFGVSVDFLLGSNNGKGGMHNDRYD